MLVLFWTKMLRPCMSDEPLHLFIHKQISAYTSREPMTIIHRGTVFAEVSIRPHTGSLPPMCLRKTGGISTRPNQLTVRRRTGDCSVHDSSSVCLAVYVRLSLSVCECVSLGMFICVCLYP